MATNLQRVSIGEYVRKSELMCTAGKMIQMLWKTMWKFFKKLKIDPPYNPVM